MGDRFVDEAIAALPGMLASPAFLSIRHAQADYVNDPRLAQKSYRYIKKPGEDPSQSDHNKSLDL